MWENEYKAFLSKLGVVTLRRGSEAFHMGVVRGINETRLDDMREINNQTPQLVALAKQITLLVAIFYDFSCADWYIYCNNMQVMLYL